MKKIILSGIIILSVMLIMPLAVMKKPETVTAMSDENIIPDASKAISQKFLICDTEKDEVFELEKDDYIFGVLAAEMPALYHEEALKAQAVAAYTFACRRKAENTDKSYDITTDHTIDQSFITKEEAEKKWGDKADEYTEKLKNAIKSVKGLMIAYNGKPILSVYHAISSGNTESCENVWGSELPYLKSVASLCDKLSPNYISTVEIKAEEFKKALNEECEFSGSEEKYISKIKKTDSGMVKTLDICGEEIKGARIRSLFSLRSSNFDVAYKDGKFMFTVYGYGHGVGMSQFGADYMAKQGSDFKEILTHYYSGCEIVTTED